jgi:hypothetical protein
MGWIYDRVRAGEYECSHPTESSLVVDVRPESIRKAKVVHAGEALDYYSFGTPTQDLITDERIHVTDFPTLRPPFATFFVEHGRTGEELIAYGGDRATVDEFHWEAGLWHYGCLFDCVDLWDGGTDLSVGSGIREMISWHCGEEAYSSWLRWLACIHLFAASPLDYPPNKKVRGFLKSWYLPINHDGSILREMSGSKGAVLTTLHHPDPKASRITRIEYDSTTVRGYLLPTLFAVSAMNSPHTRLITTVSPAGTVHDLRAARLIKILDFAGKAQEFGLRRAMYACSRHFARRLEERAARPERGPIRRRA